MTTVFVQSRVTLPRNTVHGSKIQQSTYKRGQTISYRLTTRRRRPSRNQILYQENIK